MESDELLEYQDANISSFSCHRDTAIREDIPFAARTPKNVFLLDDDLNEHLPDISLSEPLTPSNGAIPEPNDHYSLYTLSEGNEEPCESEREVPCSSEDESSLSDCLSIPDHIRDRNPSDYSESELLKYPGQPHAIICGKIFPFDMGDDLMPYMNFELPRDVDHRTENIIDDIIKAIPVGPTFDTELTPLPNRKVHNTESEVKGRSSSLGSDSIVECQTPINQRDSFEEGKENLHITDLGAISQNQRQSNDVCGELNVEDLALLDKEAGLQKWDSSMDLSVGIEEFAALTAELNLQVTESPEVVVLEAEISEDELNGAYEQGERNGTYEQENEQNRTTDCLVLTEKEASEMDISPTTREFLLMEQDALLSDGGGEPTNETVVHMTATINRSRDSAIPVLIHTKRKRSSEKQRLTDQDQVVEEEDGEEEAEQILAKPG